MIQDKIRERVQSAARNILGVDVKNEEIEITKPTSKDHGDFSTNVAFKLAGVLKKSPTEIATTVAENMATNPAFEKVESVGGFVNFFLAKDSYYEMVREILAKKEKYADSDMLKGQKIQVEFISANPTGPLTLANGRGGFGGDVLANVFTKAGAKIEREYYVNDGGNQVKILGESILVSAGLLEKDDDIYRGEYIDSWAQEHAEEVARYKDDPFALGQIAAEDVLEKLIKPSVKNMKINFDNFFSEKEMIERGEVEHSLKNVEKYKHTYVKDGAVWLKTAEVGDDKDRVLVKANGEKTYFANDIAYHHDKFYNRKFNLVVDFWGADHHGYVDRMLAATKLTVGSIGELRIVIMQMVRLIKNGQEFKMSKRKGTYVTMNDLLELIGGNVAEASDVARFFFLMRSFNTHMDFDLDLAREHSEKNPVFYVKYAYARIHGILANSKKQIPNSKGVVDFSKLTEEVELDLIDQLAQLPQVIQSILIMDGYPVHFLTFYAIEVARKFHSFYDKCRVIDEDDLETSAARLKLVEATQIVLSIVMTDLIGIDAPERM